MRWPRRRQLHRCRWKGAGLRSAQTSPHPHWCSLRWRTATAPDSGELGLGNRKEVSFYSSDAAVISFLWNVALSGFLWLTCNSSSVELFSLSDGRLNGQSQHRWQEVSDLCLPLTTGPSHHRIPFPGSIQHIEGKHIHSLVSPERPPSLPDRWKCLSCEPWYCEHSLKTVYVRVVPGVPNGSLYP